MARSRTLTFQQITDSRNIEIGRCLLELEDRIEKLRELLDIEGLEVSISDPYLIDWSDTMKKYYIDLSKRAVGDQVELFLKKAEEKQIQYRANFRIKKHTRKITWNDIYKIVNSVKAVPYDFE